MLVVALGGEKNLGIDEVRKIQVLVFLSPGGDDALRWRIVPVDQ